MPAARGDMPSRGDMRGLHVARQPRASYGEAMSDAVQIRPLLTSDREAWDPLWAGYLRFYRSELDAATSDETFRRLVAGERGMSALAAVDGAGQLVGFAHLIEHASTWATEPYLYLEDLFVDPAYRGGGVGRVLIAAIYDQADRNGNSRVYWMTEEFNWVARRTYETLATRQSFLLYFR